MNPINIIIEQFKNCDSKELYDAIDTYDMIKIVRAAENIFIKSKLYQKLSIVNKKSTKKSKEIRDIGNKFYETGNYRDALISYTKALAHAPPESSEFILAVSNRSAVLFTIKCGAACVSDINYCLSKGCSYNLTNKLMKRKKDAITLVENDVGQELAFEIRYSPIKTFFEKQFSKERHKDVRCATTDLAFSNKDGVTTISAIREILAGSVVAVETAFVTSKTTENYYLSCYFCNKFATNTNPCGGCCYATFCSIECAAKCKTDYHEIECQIMDALETVYTDISIKMATQASIKLSLKLGWDGFIAASEDVGSSRMKKASVRETFDVEDPLSLLCFEDQDNFVEGRMYNGSVMCVIILKHLDRVHNYFPKDKNKRLACRQAMSKIMLHLYVYSTNNIFLSHSLYDYKSKNILEHSESETVGWFSMAGKLTHSCEPNLLAVGLGRGVLLLALRTISEGEPLTVSFTNPYFAYDECKSTIEAPRRAYLMFMRSNKMCPRSCVLCTEDWDRNSIQDITMTEEQRQLFNIFQSRCACEDNLNIEIFKLSLQMLNAFPMKSRQYFVGYSKMKDIICIFQYIQFRSFSYLKSIN